jgi:AraC-like DNA-binding protein
LIEGNGRWHAEHTPAGIRVRLQVVGEGSLGERAGVESAMAFAVASSRDALGGAGPIEVSFRHRAPSDVRLHRQHFGERLIFDGDGDWMLLPESAANLRPRLADPILWNFLRQQADAELACLENPLSLAERVSAAVLVELDGGEPQLAKVARELGMSGRTLSRKLERESLSFRQLVEHARDRRAQELLAQGQSVTQVALALGFSETSAFSRAFRRWNGVAPSRFSSVAASVK